MDDLRYALREVLAGNGVLFLGAGAASAARNAEGTPLPTGRKLADSLAEECGLDPQYPLETIAQHYIDIKGETALINALRRNLAVKEVTPAFHSILALPWLRVWTTNYDNSAELAVHSASKTYHSVTTSDEIANSRGSRSLIVHINGYLHRVKQVLPPEFVLTSESYATQRFLQSEWAQVFKDDVKRAKAILFIGYSLADIDIARLIFNPELIKSKVHFIDKEDIDVVLASKLSKFGEVWPIGISGLAEEVESESTQWVAPALEEVYQCIEKITLPEKNESASDLDFFNLILYGELRDEFIISELDDPRHTSYCMIRSSQNDCLRHLEINDAVAVIVGSFANGKTVFTRSVALQLAAGGYDLFFVDYSNDRAITEIQELCGRQKDFALVIENYARNLDLVETFCRHARSTCQLILTERAEAHELHWMALSKRLKTRNPKVFEMDLLTDEEIENLVRLFEYRGQWGERAGLSHIQKLAYLRHDCDRKMQALLVDVAQAPQVRRRIRQIVRHFSSIESGIDILVLLCLLKAIGEQPKVMVAADLLNLSVPTFYALRDDHVTKQIIKLDSNDANFRSPVMAVAALNEVGSAPVITRIVAECVKRAEKAGMADAYLKKIGRELMRFGTLEKVLPDSRKREALQNLYEELKSVPSIRQNPHFWLQYAIARLSLGELILARRYFEQAYSIAASFRSYDTFQIDNHYCRLLFVEAENTEDGDLAYGKVLEAMTILKRQVLRENRHYPYRSAWNIEAVVKRHGSRWSEQQRRYVSESSKYLIDAAARLDDHVARSIAVTGGIERLNRTIDWLKGEDSSRRQEG